jgi:lambda repressor-like predicted transcriptional regulator
MSAKSNISDNITKLERKLAAKDSAGANSYTETPITPENGQQFAAPAAILAAHTDPQPPTQILGVEGLSNNDRQATATEQPLPESRISIHGNQTGGQQLAPETDESPDPLEDLLARALSRPRRGRPATFDDHNKGKLVALLSLGMSLRQAAAVLGVSHGTIHNTLKADPALAEEITAARFQAQLQPLACVIREARRSWKAATWLLKYLDAKIATHEETPDERRARKRSETEELVARTR